MTYIRPVSSLENYAELLSLCDEGSVVYLTENEQSKYVIQVVREYEKLKATVQLLAELSKGIESFRTEEEWTLEEAFEGLEN
ncbi:MAG: prevent-host-death protein [Clostridia bacterium]|nr:prevent-host-death protein [Clostridia bacterium]